MCRIESAIEAATRRMIDSFPWGRGGKARAIAAACDRSSHRKFEYAVWAWAETAPVPVPRRWRHLGLLPDVIYAARQRAAVAIAAQALV